MTVVFCISHMYVPATLSIIANGGDDFCIYTDLKSIYDFFSEMYPRIKVYWDKPVHSSNVVTRLLLGSYEAKKNIIKVFDNIKVNKVVFFHEGDGVRANWLIFRIWNNQKPQIFYCPVQRTFDFATKWDEVWTIKRFLLRLKIFIIWHYWSHYYIYIKDLHLVMDKSFFSKIHAKEVQLNISQTEVMDQINNCILHIDRYSYSGIAWLENTLRLTNVNWSEQSYIEMVDMVYNSLKKRRNVYFKGHPDLAVKYGAENEMTEIPSFIPGNLLVTRFSCFIGVMSALLYESANAGTTTISLLNLVDMDESIRQELVNETKRNNPNIYIPRTVEELVSLIN